MSTFISLEKAKAMTKMYRSHRESILKEEFQNQNLLAICETFDKSQIEALLHNPDSAGLRIYFGMDEDLKIHAIIVAVNEKDEDILPVNESSLSDDEDGYLIDNGMRCPPLCPPGSPLNNN